MGIFDKKYQLPLSENYVAHWGFLEAIRELLQNAIDSDSPFRCTYIDGCLRIISEDSKLSVDTLVLGTTSKAHDETKIGSFGEGYKIALLVLTRLGKKVLVHNDTKEWRPCFEHSDVFDTSILTIYETGRTKGYSDRLVFVIHDVSQEEYDEVKNACIHLWLEEDFGEVLETKYGRIMTQRSGQLFVNGLFVCTTPLEYSYDVKPEYMSLERDRKTVDDWNLKLLTKNMWFDTQLWDRIAEMIEANCPDLYNSDLGTPKMVQDACYRLFKSKYPGHVAAKTQEELDKFIANKMEKVIVVNATYHSVLNMSGEYGTSHHALIRNTPREDLEVWLRENRKYMRKESIVSFKSLVDKSSGWACK